MSAWTYRCQSAGKAAAKIVPLRPRTPCWKGLGADSEEKREPVSDINTALVDSLKALDPIRPIREADMAAPATSAWGAIGVIVTFVAAIGSS
jgi:antitoxin (DNA-binding transcriptional repressor) of toxin-antitoxin stability system